MAVYEKINDGLYKTELKGQPRDITVNYDQQQLIFTAVAESGAIDFEDIENLNPYALVRNFGRVASILLNTYDEDGNLTKAGNCNLFLADDIVKLVVIGLDVFRFFVNALNLLNQADKAIVEKVKKTKKAE